MPVRYRVLTYRYSGSHRAEQLMQRVWECTPPAGWAAGPEWRPPTDVLETPDAVVVKVELAGACEDEISVTVYADLLLIAGERRDDTPKSDDITYHEAGIRYGPFQAQIALPGPIDRERIVASYERGLLEVKLPKQVMSDES